MAQSSLSRSEVACVARGSPLRREDVLRGRGLLIVGISFFLSGIRFVAPAEASCVLAREYRVDASDFMGCFVIQAMRTMKFMLREEPERICVICSHV